MRIVTQYDTAAIDFGVPEQLMDNLLFAARIDGVMTGAGTDLQTGVRDVSYELDAPLDVVADLLDRANREGIVWLLEPGEEEER
jgi:hypothetical protein